jgi:hypothetical protein
MVLIDPVTVSDDVATVIATDKTPEPTQQVDQNDAGLPDKFKGKSTAEIVAAYQNLETELGRSRNEIGTSRRVIDELLQIRPRQSEKSEPVAKPVTPYDLAENPDEVITTIAKRVADERSSTAEHRLAAIENDLAASQFEKKRPGFRDTLSSSEFQTWLQGNQRRIRLVQAAGQGDWDAGDEVLGLYEEYKAAPAKAPSQATDAAKQAGLAKSGGSGANKVVNSGDGKKIYKREDLASLYIRDPEAYARLSDSGELNAAYREKRVR